MVVLNSEDIRLKLFQIREAYQELFLGSQTLIELDALSWPERWLLRLVNRLAQQRLGQIGKATAALPNPESKKQLRETLLAFQVDASLAGHDLSSWEETEDGPGYQAICRRCGASVYASDGPIYSILAEICPGTRSEGT